MNKTDYFFPIIEATRDLQNLANRLWDEWAALPENQRIARAARLLCEEAGSSPETLCSGEVIRPKTISGRGYVAFEAPIVPTWATYLTPAREALDLADKLK